jgi:hypothetical protein
MIPVQSPDRRQMTLSLTEAEMTALESLATKKDLSKTALIRQALRLYQLVDMRTSSGERLVLEDEKQQKKAEVMML